MDTYRICPDCRAEYNLTAQNCADCGTILIWPNRTAEPDRLGVSDAGWDLGVPGAVLGQLAVDTQLVVEGYLGHLERAGIAGAVLPQTAYQSKDTRLMYSPVFGTALLGGKAGQVPVGSLDEGFIYLLFVAHTDYEAAERVIADAFAELHPGDEGGLQQEFEAGACPACQSPVAEAAAECPDCGLHLG